MLTNDENRPASILSCWSDETIVHKVITENNTDNDPSTTRPRFIVKRLYRKQSESHRQFIKRVSSEYCIVSVLSHINVVGALNLLMENYSFSMVMNLVQMGDPLSIIIKSSHMTLSDMINYFKQLVQATRYIQDLGVAHRNIRPENILVFSDGCVKLTGFGDALVFRSPLQNHQLQSQGRVGTLAYQPPEVLLWWGHCISQSSSLSPSYFCIEKKKDYRRKDVIGDNSDQTGYYSSAIDIWSLGVVLLHMLKGHCPWSVPCQYHDPDYAQFVTYNQHRPFPITLSLPPTLCCLIYRMLNPNPSSRIDIQQLATSI